MPISGRTRPADICPAYFESLKQLDDYAASSTPLRQGKLEGILEYTPRRPATLELLRKRGKLLVCHDYKGGYTESPFALAYTFNFWSSCDTFVYFSHHRITVPPPGWVNAAHRQGVKMLGTLIFEGGGEEDCLRLLVGKIPQSKTGSAEQPAQALSLPLSLHYARLLADLAQDRGFDGYLLNFECPLQGGIEQTRALAAWITLLQSEILKKVGPHGETIWYDSVIFTGRLAWQDRLNSLNLPFFLSSSGLFTNYTWWRDGPTQTAEYFLSLDPALTGNAPSSQAHVSSKSLRDIYTGVDVWGRGSHGGGGFGSYKAISHISPESLGLSVALFGQAWTWESEQDKAGWDWDKWWAYESKLWVGPAKQGEEVQVPEAPRRENEPECLHGPFVPIASFFKRHSPPDPYELPFHTSFCPGVGRTWFVQGKKVFQSESGWTDVDKQGSGGDLMWPRPALQWEDERKEPLPEASSTIYMEDAWAGGSSLQIAITADASDDETAAYRCLWMPIQSLSITPEKMYEATVIYKVQSLPVEVDLEFGLSVKLLSEDGHTIEVSPLTSAESELDDGWFKLAIQFNVSGSQGSDPASTITVSFGLIVAIVTEDPASPHTLAMLLGQMNVYPSLPPAFQSEHDTLVLWADFQPTSGVQASPLSGILSWETAASLPIVQNSIRTTEDPISAWKLQPSTANWFPSFLYFNIYAQLYSDEYTVGKVGDAIWVGTSRLDGRKNQFAVLLENLPFTSEELGKTKKVRFYVQGVTDRGVVLHWNRCVYIDVSV